jgi:hypothetical protein
MKGICFSAERRPTKTNWADDKGWTFGRPERPKVGAAPGLAGLV